MSKNQMVNGHPIDWSGRIASALDVHALEAIDHELQAMGLDARKWRIAVAVRKRALMGLLTVTPKPSPVTPINPPISTAFAEAFGIPAVDGRRLHAYRIGHRHFESLQQHLAARKSYDVLAQGHRPGLFVLWASEWFRRSHSGGLRCWEDLTNVLGLPAPSHAEQTALRAVTGKGLKQWGRPIYSSGMNYFLATLAREGGFPAFAVADGGQGWAKTVLETIVGQLMGVSSAGEDVALEYANTKAR
ncbi:MAG: hypothetical protein ACK4ZW_17935 [Blastomonas sp.]